MPSVVKHSYMRGTTMKSRAAAHIRYILYRSDEGREVRVEREASRRTLQIDEREEVKVERLDEKSATTPEQKLQEAIEHLHGEEGGGNRNRARQMHSQDSDSYTGVQLMKDVSQLGRNDVVHKLILSPGHNDVDMKEYVRETMRELGRAKGLQLKYGFVNHENTNHKHAHVLLLGRDKEGLQVRIDKTDHLRLRAFGDRYLEREHNVERVLTREMEEFCRTRNLNPMFAEEWGKQFYDRLYKDDKKKERNPTDTQLEWEKFNNDWKQFIEDKEGTERRPYLGKTVFHDLGRMSDFNALMHNDLQKQIWQDIQQNRPELKDIASAKLEQLDLDRAELKKEIDLKTDTGEAPKILDNLSERMSDEARAFNRLMELGVNCFSHTGVDLTQVDEKDTLRVDDKTYTKYDSLEELQNASKELEKNPADLLQEEYGKLRIWIWSKERYGEDCYGDTPRRERKELDIGWSDSSQDKPDSKTEKVMEPGRFEERDGNQVDLKFDPTQYLVKGPRDALDYDYSGEQRPIKEREVEPIKELSGASSIDFSDSRDELKGLDDFTGFGDSKKLDLEMAQGFDIEPTRVPLNWEPLHELTFEPASDPQLSEPELTIDESDFAFFEGPLYIEELTEDFERDDGSDLFSQGIM